MLGLLKRQKGFTLIELLAVIVLIALMFSMAVPVSYDMVRRYRAVLRAQEVMTYVSELRRDSFLYSEEHLLDSRDNTLTVDGNDIPFPGALITVESPILFYRTGATSSGSIQIIVDKEHYRLNVTAPFGALNLEPEETTA